MHFLARLFLTSTAALALTVGTTQPATAAPQPTAASALLSKWMAALPAV